MELLFISLGFLGGIVRALYGLLKALNNGARVRLGYFVLTAFVAGAIGGLLGNFFDIDYRIAALAGYVGTDILENLLDSAIPKAITLEK